MKGWKTSVRAAMEGIRLGIRLESTHITTTISISINTPWVVDPPRPLR
jgi:hypothetical protein